MNEKLQKVIQPYRLFLLVNAHLEGIHQYVEDVVL